MNKIFAEIIVLKIGKCPYNEGQILPNFSRAALKSGFGILKKSSVLALIYFFNNNEIIYRYSDDFPWHKLEFVD